MKFPPAFGREFFIEFLFDFFLTKTFVRVIVFIEQKFETGGFLLWQVGLYSSPFWALFFWPPKSFVSLKPLSAPLAVLAVVHTHADFSNYHGCSWKTDDFDRRSQIRRCLYFQRRRSNIEKRIHWQHVLLCGGVLPFFFCRWTLRHPFKGSNDKLLRIWL